TITVNEEIEIPKDSKALLKPGDLFGSMQINIEMGASNELAMTGDTLIPERSGDLFSEVNEQLRPIKIKTKSLLGSIDSVLQVIEAILNTESQENLVQSFRGINASIQNLERATFRIDTLVGEERVRIRAIFKNIEEVSTVLKDNSDEFANVIQNFSTISDTLAQADIAGTITKANKALTEVDQIVEKINKGEGSLGMLINNPGLYNRLDSAAKNLDYLVEDIRVNPNRYIHFSVFGRKNKSVDLTKKELEQLKDYVKSSEEENE
ncbi:MAG: MlaD family protein, partial [Cryomorphaceae bacterium]